MQDLKYTIGHWQAHARLEEIEPGKLLAVISVIDEKGAAQPDSRYTVVFDHHPGQDKVKETEMLVQQLMRDRYGFQDMQAAGEQVISSATMACSSE